MRFSKSRHRMIYVTALGLIALLVFAMKFQLGATFKQMEDDGGVIDVAGRQRMLSQRIARESMALAHALEADQHVKLEQDLRLWIASHNGLIRRDPSLGLSGENSDAVRALFAELGPHYSGVVERAELLLDYAEDGEASGVGETEAGVIARELGVYADRFLPVMDRIVNTYAAESAETVEALKVKEAWLSGIILFVLVLEALLIFEPLLRRMSRTVEQLKASSAEAERANRVKSEFLANMSHEIRTPMGAILGYTDLLKQADGDAAQLADCIDTIERNSKHLMAVINDVLDMSKIEAGQMAVERITMQPAQVVEEAVSLIRPQALRRELPVTIRYTTPIPASIQSDPTRLRQVLINLIGNAIKFTENGGITVEVGCDWDAQQMVFTVIDTGIGMTPEQREKIAAFAPFTQADTSTTRKYGGSGLGLRISNTLANLLGGRIAIESELNRGSRFTLTIQTGDLTGVERIEPEQVTEQLLKALPAQAEACEQAQPLDGLEVLLVEDGVDNQRLIRHHLEKAGAKVTIAANGRLAIELLETLSETAPDVVLMDMQMPEMDGYTATRLLRKRGWSVPIVALTAHAMQGDRELCLAAGCDDYLTKPIEPKLLRQACARVASRSAAA